MLTRKCAVKLIQKSIGRQFSNLENHHRHRGWDKIFCRVYATKKQTVSPQQVEELPTFQYAPAKVVPDWRVYAWGLSAFGALGNHNMQRPRRHHTYVPKPSRLTFAELHKVTDVACGYGFTVFAVASKEEHKVFGTGLNTDSQIGYHAQRKDHPLETILLPVPISIPLKSIKSTKVIRVACGRAHTFILTDKEGLFTLGNNAYGQCGRRVIENEQYFGSSVIHHIPSIDDHQIVDVICGQDHSMFLTENGAIYSCGWGADGQTGLGHFKSQTKPAPIVGDAAGEKIVRLSSAADCVLALNDKGDVFGWGNSEYGQLLSASRGAEQSPTARHIPLSGLGKIVDIAAGGSFCLALNDEGHVFVWGYGVLGCGPAVERLTRPTAIPAPLFGRTEFQPDSRVARLATGVAHCAALTSTGDLYTWGRNRSGCLGLGHTDNQYFPLKVAVGAQVVKVSCGVDHTVALCRSYV